MTAPTPGASQSLLSSGRPCPQPRPREQREAGGRQQGSAYLLHAQLARPHVQWRGRLSAGQRHIVLAGQVQLPDDLGLQLSIALAAVADAFPLPLLGAVTVLAHSEPVRGAPATGGSQQGEARSSPGPARVDNVPQPKPPITPGAWGLGPGALGLIKRKDGFQPWPPPKQLANSKFPLEAQMAGLAQVSILHRSSAHPGEGGSWGDTESTDGTQSSALRQRAWPQAAA